jgi:hypothetical protein
VNFVVTVVGANVDAAIEKKTNQIIYIYFSHILKKGKKSKSLAKERELRFVYHEKTTFEQTNKQTILFDKIRSSVAEMVEII